MLYSKLSSNNIYYIVGIMKASCGCRVGIVRGSLMDLCRRFEWFKLFDQLHKGI